MKKRNIRQQDVNKSQQKSTGTCNICSIIQTNPKTNYLFQRNYERISRTINEGMQKLAFLSTINRILQRQPSRQSITYQQVEKNLVFYQHLEQYFTIHKTNQRISALIIKQIPFVKANYMDFKIKNFLILNKYRVINEKLNLPYPLCVQFQKQTDSKMSSTKSVENKVLQELDKQGQTKKSKRVNHHPQQQSKSITKKQNKLSQKSKEKFQIKALTKGIQQMIQNIKDARALEHFKKQMEKTSQFKFDTPKFNDSESKETNKNSKTKKNVEYEKTSIKLNQLKEKQFKRRLDNDMSKNFPEDKNKIIQPLKISSFRSIQRLQTVPDYGFEEYGLSVIKQKRKRSKSKKNKSKSGDYSHWSKQSSGKLTSPKTKRLQTQYDNSSTLRLNTAHCMLMKSKSSSRIPTQYDSGVILRSKKQKSKSKYEHFLFSSGNKTKKQSKSSSISSQNGVSVQGFKKSKSKSKCKLLEFQSSTKLVKK